MTDIVLVGKQNRNYNSMSGKRKSGSSCVAVGCSMRTGTNLLSEVKMYRFPTDPDRRKQWEIAVKRENWVATTNSRLCNQHFFSGKPSLDPVSPDYIPQKFIHKNRNNSSQSQDLDRYQRENKRRKISVPLQSISIAEETSSQELDSIMTGKTDVGTMTDLSGEDISKMESLLDGYKAQVALLRESAEKNTVYARITNNIRAFNFYTKFPTFTLFCGLLKLVMYNWKPKAKTSLDFSEQLLLVLMKLRLGLINDDLAYRFSIQRTMVGCIFREWIQRLAQVLGPQCVRKPSLTTLRQNIPRCFREANLEHVTSIIDCSEIFIQKPFNLDTRAQTYSNYKHHNTMKFLISITPTGCIEFISKLYGGRVSDKEITNLSGFLDTLNENDVILADRGFSIKDAVSLKNAHVILPASTKNKTQLSAIEVIDSRKISRVRVHVERCIGRVKSYWILKTIWPISYFSSNDEETCIGDNILTVIAALCNISKTEIVKK